MNEVKLHPSISVLSVQGMTQDSDRVRGLVRSEAKDDSFNSVVRLRKYSEYVFRGQKVTSFRVNYFASVER